MTRSLVIDTWPLLCLLQGEPEAGQVRQVLEMSRRYGGHALALAARVGARFSD